MRHLKGLLVMAGLLGAGPALAHEVYGEPRVRIVYQTHAPVVVHHVHRHDRHAHRHVRHHRHDHDPGYGYHRWQRGHRHGHGCRHWYY